ncbi:MAG: hypothetical protein ACRDEA_19520, partial [Microcystaceae cyanobacterium]
MANCYLGIANNNLFLNEFEESIIKAEFAKAFAMKAGQDTLIAHAERLIGNANFFLGKFTKALKNWDTALNLFQSLSVPKDIHWVNEWRCICLIQLNRIDEALQLCEALVSEASYYEWGGELAAMTYFRGTIQVRREFYQEGTADFLVAAQLFEQLQEPHWVARVNLEHAELLVRLDDYIGARHLLGKAENEFTRQEMPKWLAQIWLVQSKITQAEGSLDKAELLIHQAQGFIRAYNIPALNYQVSFQLAEIAERKNQSSKALDHYCQAITQLERIRGSVTLELRGDFLKDKMQVYEAAVFTALNQADIERAYDYIERSKSRALTE